ncbi:hydrolase [Cohnella abietis]|uniref:Hydrolase n=1 Tax=Cohnella abietis TaxID=2507935 RepID=A0A3T1CYW0_9BACL|nr:hydrolase [Cohnella abietis]
MLIATGIAVLDISASVLGRIDTVHPVLLWDEQQVILVDTGFPRQLNKLREAVDGCGVSFDTINRIILTHQDIDHIGNLPDIIQQASTKIEVMAHIIEKPYIQGEQRILRFTDEAIESINHMPDHVPEAFKIGLKALMLNPPSAPVDHTIAGGEQLPGFEFLTIIDTPGHTPGHISLYHEPSRTLIAGDALVVRDGQLHGPDPVSTLDKLTAMQSLNQFSSFNIDTVVCYHGGLFRGNVNERISELLTLNEADLL